MKKKPEFLRDVVLSPATVRRLRPHMGNWIKVHAHMTSLPVDAPGTLTELKLMLLYELTTARRLDVIHRLFRSMHLIRRTQEERQLIACTRGART